MYTVLVNVHNLKRMHVIHFVPGHFLLDTSFTVRDCLQWNTNITASLN